MRKLVVIGSVIIASQLTGCASVVSGAHQKISVVTTPVEGAQCSLDNDKGKWNISKTPDSVLVHKSGKNLVIMCEKKGYNKARSEVKPELNKAVYGNILVGGAIGGAIDRSNGSAYQYPVSVKVTLVAKK